MTAVSTESILTQLRWRYATKKFDATKKIAPDVWAKLEQAAILSPSSYGLQPWKFVVITDPAMRVQLHAASWNQPQITDASHLIVFAAKNPPLPTDVEDHIACVADVRGVPVETLDGYKQMMLGSLSRMSAAEAHVWAMKQCYIALGFFLSACALAGVDACPMEGFVAAQYDEILGLKALGLSAAVIATAGYRSADDATAAYPKVRFDVEDVVIRV